MIIIIQLHTIKRTSFICCDTVFHCPEVSSLWILVTHSIVGNDSDTVRSTWSQTSECCSERSSAKIHSASIGAKVVRVTMLHLIVEVSPATFISWSCPTHSNTGLTSSQRQTTWNTGRTYSNIICECCMLKQQSKLTCACCSRSLISSSEEGLGSRGSD